MNQKEQYRAFCRQAADLPIFMHDWYLDGAMMEEKWDVVGLVDGQGAPQAFLPYCYKRKFGFTYITMPPFVKYMGPFILPKYRILKKEHILQQQLIQQLPKVSAFKQNFTPLTTNWLPFFWAGYRQTTRYTYRLEDVRELDAVYAGFNRNIKRNIRKASDKLILKKDLAPEKFYAINEKSFSRQGLKAPYSRDRFLKHHESLQKNKAGKILYAEDERGALHSAAYLIWDKNSSYYHLSGDDPNLRESGAGIWLIWQAIQYTAKTLKLDRFDFEGSILPAVERIRLQFGARQTPYFYVWKYHSSWYRFLDRL